MITAVIINTQATLNNFAVTNTVSYVPGTTAKLNFQIQDPETGIRLIPGTGATCTAAFLKNDGTNNVKTCTMLFNPDDRSLWTTTLSPTDTMSIIGSNFILTLDVLGDGTDIRQGLIRDAIAQILIDGAC
jgi:hypothetical protein